MANDDAPVRTGRGRDESAARPESSRVVGTALGGRLAELAAELAAVRQVLATLDEHAAVRDRAFDRLHEDLERLWSGERHQAVRPLLTDLQRLRDDLLRQAVALPADVTSAQVAALLESFAYDIEQTLARGGIEVLHPEVGSPFDPSRQRAAEAVPAMRAELEGTVAAVLSDGYLDTTVDRALTSAIVRVYRHVQPIPDTSAQ